MDGGSPLVTPTSSDGGHHGLVATAVAAQRDRNSGVVIVYLQCYFVTIATILGTGILGLPVTLSNAGLYPFLLTFIGGFLIQVLLIVFFTDILQRAHALQVANNKEGGRTSESVPLNDILEGDTTECDTEEEIDDDYLYMSRRQGSMSGPLVGHVIIPKTLAVRAPNLHLLGELFLGCGIRQLFGIVLILQFIAILISYALAGSQAFAEIIGIDFFYVIPVFVWVLTFFIVFALQIIQPVVSILTFVKGSLLLATVVITFLVGAGIHHDITNNFEYVGAPFLMGTIAMGGVVNVMPFLYGKIKPVQNQVSGYRGSIISGLTTCMILNILWCWAVLEIVPQKNSCFTYHVSENNSLHQVSGTHMQQEMVCAQNLSLESSAYKGEISTIPLTQIIHHLYPQFDWLALMIELFIMISITVSFLTVGAALHHTLSGWVDSFWHEDKFTSYKAKMHVTSQTCPCINIKCILQSILSLLVFLLVFAIAMINPQGFVPMLEKAASFVANLEAGLFVFLMIQTALNTDNKNLNIPLPLPNWAYHLQYLFPLYFGFACGYDIWISIYDLIDSKVKQIYWEQEHDSWMNPAPGVLVAANSTNQTLL